jgi:hypothetical protein
LPTNGRPSCRQQAWGNANVPLPVRSAVRSTGEHPLDGGGHGRRNQPNYPGPRHPVLPVEVRRLQSSGQVDGGSQPDSDDDENGSGYGHQDQRTMLLHAAKLLIVNNEDEAARDVPICVPLNAG